MPCVRATQHDQRYWRTPNPAERRFEQVAGGKGKTRLKASRQIPGIVAILACLYTTAAQSQAADLHRRIDAATARVESNVIAWRHDIHEHPELGNREFRTARLVADHLRSLGLEVKTGVAKTGVVALLKGGKPGPVVALRADMDALPIAEQTGLSYASKAKGMFEGKEVAVSHACGHDSHVAILMGVATVLAGVKNDIAGSVKFIFQPAEEGPPEGEEGGASLMVKEGVLENPKVSAVLGLHAGSELLSGTIAYRSGPLMASADVLHIKVKGRGTHGSAPWTGVDPIVLASQVVLGLQTIASRQVEVTKEPSVITIGMIHGGNRENVIPDVVELTGTIRTFDEAMKKDIHARIRRTAESIAASGGGSAEVAIESPYKVTVNDPALTARLLPSLMRAAGGNVVETPRITGSEDFSYYHEHIPGLFLFLGVTAKGIDPAKAPYNHSAKFTVDDAGLALGVRALSSLAVDYLAGR